MYHVFPTIFIFFPVVFVLVNYLLFSGLSVVFVVSSVLAASVEMRTRRSLFLLPLSLFVRMHLQIRHCCRV